MGFIDSDAHVRESDKTWEYFDPGERHLAPKELGGNWQIGDLFSGGPFDPDATPEEYHRLFPNGSADLSDPDARIRRMDDLGVDVQILFSTWWIGSDVFDPIHEAALARSWNRWMAEATDRSAGRLLWTLQAPVRMPERALEEMEFSKRHGAVGVHMRGLRHGIGLGDPVNFPIYERAQDLDLVVAIHVGGDMRVLQRQPHMVMLNNLAPVPGAFHSVLKTGLHERFPRLRWAFLESGASWLPFVIQEAMRSDGYAGFRNFKDWRESVSDLLSNQEMYVACQIDDDLPYLIDMFGGDNLVLGTDYGHLDVGSDPYALQMLAERSGRHRATFGRIVDSNARRLWAISSDFTPAPRPREAIPEMSVVDNWMAANLTVKGTSGTDGPS